MSTSFRTTGVTVTPGGGGAGFASSDAHPERVQRSRSDTQRNCGGLIARLSKYDAGKIEVVSRFRASGMKPLNSAVIRFASWFRRLLHTNHTKRLVLMIAVRSDLLDLERCRLRKRQQMPAHGGYRIELNPRRRIVGAVLRSMSKQQFPGSSTRPNPQMHSAANYRPWVSTTCPGYKVPFP